MTDPSLHYNLMLIKLAFETNGKSEQPRKYFYKMFPDNGQLAHCLCPWV